MTPSQMQKADFTIQSFVADLYPELTPPFKTKFNLSVKYSTLQYHHALIPHHLCLWLKITQLCLTICNPMDCSPPDSSVHGILQARILEWVAIPFSRICLYIFSKYLFGHKVPSGFSIRWYEKTQIKFLANPIQYIWRSKWQPYIVYGCMATIYVYIYIHIYIYISVDPLTSPRSFRVMT